MEQTKSVSNDQEIFPTDISINNDNKFIVDKQFIKIFKKLFNPNCDFEFYKENLVRTISSTTNMDDLYTELENQLDKELENRLEQIYLNKVANHPYFKNDY